MVKGIEELEKLLNHVFEFTIVLPDGAVVEQRKLVERVGGLKIEVYPNEHPPPHFHVISNDINVSVDILTGELIKGKLGRDDLKRIKYFYNTNKSRLIDVWNEMRPSDCPVGRITLQ